MTLLHITPRLPPGIHDFFAILGVLFAVVFIVACTLEEIVNRRHDRREEARASSAEQ